MSLFLNILLNNFKISVIYFSPREFKLKQSFKKEACFDILKCTAMAFIHCSNAFTYGACCMSAHRFTSLIVICSTLRSCIWVPWPLSAGSCLFVLAWLIYRLHARPSVFMWNITTSVFCVIIIMLHNVCPFISSLLFHVTSLEESRHIAWATWLTAAEAEGSHKVKMVIPTQKQWKYLSLAQSI